MTTADLINYYASLLPLQYLGKPRAYATVQALVAPAVMQQTGGAEPALPLAVQGAFNLTGTGLAVGVQLDILGKYAGVTRTGVVPSTGSVITLSDADFVTFIQMAIIKNVSGSSFSAIQAFLNQFFPGIILAFDYQNMAMSYMVSTTLGSLNLIKLFIVEGLLPKPMGVQLASVIYAPSITTFFGMRSYIGAAVHSSPFNSYASYNSTTAPWLSYSYSVVPS